MEGGRAASLARARAAVARARAAVAEPRGGERDSRGSEVEGKDAEAEEEDDVQAAALRALDTARNPPANISDVEARQALSGILQGLQDGSLAFADTDPMSEYDGHGPDVTFGAM